MALPLKLRNYYDKVVTPVTGMVGQLNIGGRHRAGNGPLTGTNVQHMVQAYVTMNRFLSRFLEHVSYLTDQGHLIMTSWASSCGYIVSNRK